ncbi:MAG: DUF2208 domain-containing protein [Desulfurococcus sp.]|nr:DUF2208 domain-containing protein [Desulfurococcus sp.]
MAVTPSRKTMLLIQLASIVVFALVSAIIPQYAFIVFILYFVVFMIIAAKSSAKTMKVPPRSELGSPIFKESKAAQVMLMDKTLQAELGKQMKIMMLQFALIFLVLFLLPVYNDYIWPLVAGVAGLTNGSILVNFLRYLGMYLFFIGVMQAFRRLLIREQQALQPGYLAIARSFTVYRKGVVLDEARFIDFTQDICFKVEAERKFVELRNSKNNTPLTRLYTLEVNRLVEKLEEAGLSECRA